MAEGLATAVAGGCDAEVVGGDAVLHIGGEHAVFDQQVGAGLVALIVDVERAAAFVERGVVEHGDERGCDGLADAVGVVAGLFAVEVGFKAVSDGLVEQDAGVAGGEDDGERAGGRVPCVLLEAGLAGGFTGKGLGGMLLEVGHAHASAAAPAGDAALLAEIGAAGDVEADERLEVGDHASVAADDQDALFLVDEGGFDAGDALVVLAGCEVGAAQQLDFLREGRVGCGGGGGVAIGGILGGGDVDRRDIIVGAVGDLGGCRSGAAHGVEREVLAVGVADGVAFDDADADALRECGLRGGDALILVSERAAAFVLKVELGERAAAREGGVEDAVGGCGVYAEALRPEPAHMGWAVLGLIAHTAYVAHVALPFVGGAGGVAPRARRSAISSVS